MAILLLLFLFRSRTVSPFIPQYHRTTFNREIPTSAAAQPDNAFGEANPDLFDDADLMGGFDLSKLVDNYAAVGGAVGGDNVKSDVKSENSVQPLNQMSYFYLRDRLDLSESDLWRLTWLGGGVLGLSRAKLGDKLDWFVNVFDFDEEVSGKVIGSFWAALFSLTHNITLSGNTHTHTQYIGPEKDGQDSAVCPATE